MQAKSNDIIDRLFKPGSKNRLAKTVIFALAMLPVIILALYSYVQLDTELTNRAYDRRQALAQLAGEVVEQHFNTLVQVGTSLANRPALIAALEKNDWQAGIETVAKIPEQFPYIERVALNDPAGTARANIPKAPGLGMNFAYRDWYQGVTKNWTPYVSEVFQRAVEPKTSVVGVAIPILGDKERHLGILLMQVDLDTLLKWSQEVQVGGGGYIYVVDRSGHAMAHPVYKSDTEVVDLSRLPAVQAALESSSGVGIFYNPIEKEDRLYAYWTSSIYGFSVGFQEPKKSAFATRDSLLRTIVLIYGGVLVLNFALAWLLWRLIRALIDQHQKEHIYLASMGDGIVVIDRDWTITMWNAAATALTGWRAEEAIGQPFREKVRFLREHDRKENIGFIEEALLFGVTKQMSESTVLVTKDGKDVPVSDSAAPILDANGKATGIIIVFRDDTQSRDSRILKTDFAYASHQLRTPITKALWSLEAAEEETANETKKKVQTARRAVLDMQKMSERLLEVSSIDQQTVFARPQPVSIANVISDAVASCTHEAEARHVRIVTHDIPATVRVETDGKLLRRALEEIIMNAVSYSPSKAVVDIQTLVQTNELLIEIRDTGIGIAEEQQPLVFTKFFRGQNIPPDVSGVGLGLFIVREYVKLLGGRVWFVSELGRGTTFSVTIPMTKNGQHDT